MRQKLALLLALVLAVSLLGCGAMPDDPAEGLVVTDYAVDIPDGFETVEMQGFAFYYMAADGSNINMSIQDKGSMEAAAFDVVSADLLRKTLTDGFKDTYDLEVEVTDRYFNRDDVGGFPSYQYAFTYELNGTELSQLIVSVKVDKIYTITYTDASGDWMDTFEAGVEDITFTTEDAEA